MLVLALDTATPTLVAGVARWSPEGTEVLAERAVPSPTKHAELLTPAVRAALDDAGVALADMEVVVTGLGPGPFTGLRVGIVTAAALSDALGIPAYGVCSLDAVAADDDGGGGRLVLADARRREVYWAEYDRDGLRLAGPEVEKPAGLAERVRATGWTGRLLGDGAHRYADQFAGLEVADSPRFPGGEAVVLLAAGRALAGAPSEPLTPLYLRRPDAEQPGAPKRVTA